MKRARFARRGGLTRDAERLTRLATGLALSASRVETLFWQRDLAELVQKLLNAGNEDALNAALDQLWRADARTYDALADFIEAGAESMSILINDQPHDVLLFAAPVLAWSRFSIQAGSIAIPALQNLHTQLSAHVLAADTRLTLVNYLFSPDQLPRSYTDTHQLVGVLANCLTQGLDLSIDPAQLETTLNFLSDTRYVLGALAAPRGAPMFRWQEEDMQGSARETVLTQWRTQGGAILQPMLPACALEVLLPNAYHHVCREADRASRPYSLRASVAFLEATLSIKPDGLRAVIAPFYDQQLEEYRIGFTQTDSNEVMHGVVWAMLGPEDENTDTVEEIERVLRGCGLDDILVIDHRMPMEYCDDCGAPMYPDPEGQPVHAELPEEAASQQVHLH